MTTTTNVIVCCFTTSLGDLAERPKRCQTTRAVLAALHASGRMSAFDCAEDKIARAVDRLARRGAIEITPEAFPWSRVRVTDVGMAMMTKGAR